VQQVVRQFLVHVEIETPIGRIDETLELPAGEVFADDLAPAFRRIADALVALAVAQAAASGQAVTCRAGCGACCRQLVPLAEPELIALARLVERLPEPRQATIRARFAAALTTLESAGLLDALRQPPSDPQANLALNRAYFELGLACPFLERESCSIHRERPTMCREYNVLTPATGCRAPFTDTVRPVAVPVYQGNVLAAAGERSTGRRTRITPLVLALEWVAANPARRGPRALATAHLADFVDTLRGKLTS